MTKIVVARPPNFEAILAVFPHAADEGVMFAWDGTIFSPDGDYVPPQLIAHEEVHFEQQRVIGGPEAWWDSYLKNPSFRFRQEREAHIVEYQSFVHHTRNRRMLRAYLDQVAQRLSGPLYGHATSFTDAYETIKRGAVSTRG